MTKDASKDLEPGSRAGYKYHGEMPKVGDRGPAPKKIKGNESNYSPKAKFIKDAVKQRVYKGEGDEYGDE